RLEQAQQILAGCTFLPIGLLVVVAELPLQDAVQTPHFLLLAQLHAVVRKTRATRAVLSRRGFGTTLRVERTHAGVQEEIRAFASRELESGTEITSHALFVSSYTRLLNAPLLRRAAAVVRYRRHVGDAVDPQARRVQRTHRRVPARAWTLHI